MNELAKWYGWTIDLRLRQFRKVEGQRIEFLPFNSPEGEALFDEYCQDMYDYYIEKASGYQAIQLDIENRIFSLEDADMLAKDMGVKE